MKSLWFMLACAECAADIREDTFYICMKPLSTEHDTTSLENACTYFTFSKLDLSRSVLTVNIFLNITSN